MASFGRRDNQAGSGIDKPEPVSFRAKWKGWVADFLRPLKRAPAQDKDNPIRRKKR